MGSKERLGGMFDEAEVWDREVERGADWPVTVLDVRVWKLYKSRFILDQSARIEAAATFLNAVS